MCGLLRHILSPVLSIDQAPSVNVEPVELQAEILPVRHGAYCGIGFDKLAQFGSGDDSIPLYIRSIEDLHVPRDSQSQTSIDASHPGCRVRPRSRVVCLWRPCPRSDTAPPPRDGFHPQPHDAAARPPPRAASAPPRAVASALSRSRPVSATTRPAQGGGSAVRVWVWPVNSATTTIEGSRMAHLLDPLPKQLSGVEFNPSTLPFGRQL